MSAGGGIRVGCPVSENAIKVEPSPRPVKQLAFVEMRPWTAKQVTEATDKWLADYYEQKGDPQCPVT